MWHRETLTNTLERHMFWWLTKLQIYSHAGIPTDANKTTKKNRQKTRVNQKNGSILICDAPTRSSKATTWNDILAYQNVCFFLLRKKRTPYIHSGQSSSSRSNTDTNTGYRHNVLSMIHSPKLRNCAPASLSILPRFSLHFFFSQADLRQPNELIHKNETHDHIIYVLRRTHFHSFVFEQRATELLLYTVYLWISYQMHHQAILYRIQSQSELEMKLHFMPNFCLEIVPEQIYTDVVRWNISCFHMHADQLSATSPVIMLTAIVIWLTHSVT